MKKQTAPGAEQAKPDNPRAGAQRVTYYVSGSDDTPPPQPEPTPADAADTQE